MQKKMIRTRRSSISISYIARSVTSAQNKNHDVNENPNKEEREFMDQYDEKSESEKLLTKETPMSATKKALLQL